MWENKQFEHIRNIAVVSTKNQADGKGGAKPPQGNVLIYNFSVV